jgi:hypothetical protein
MLDLNKNNASQIATEGAERRFLRYTVLCRIVIRIILYNETNRFKS